MWGDLAAACGGVGDDQGSFVLDVAPAASSAEDALVLPATHANLDWADLSAVVSDSSAAPPITDASWADLSEAVVTLPEPCPPILDWGAFDGAVSVSSHAAGDQLVVNDCVDVDACDDRRVVGAVRRPRGRPRNVQVSPDLSACTAIVPVAEAESALCGIVVPMQCGWDTMDVTRAHELVVVPKNEAGRMLVAPERLRGMMSPNPLRVPLQAAIRCANEGMDKKRDYELEQFVEQRCTTETHYLKSKTLQLQDCKFTNKKLARATSLLGASIATFNDMKHVALEQLVIRNAGKRGLHMYGEFQFLTRALCLRGGGVGFITRKRC